MNGEWIRRPTHGTTVVFVHGILSSSDACWRHANGAYWPAILADEEVLKSVGVYVFTYQTTVFSGTYRLGDVVDALKEQTRLDGVLDSRQIIFVCHSMGGIIVRKFLVERQTDFINSNHVLGLFLVASPSLGSSYADWLSPLAAATGHSQASSLRFVRSNEWLMDLDKEFMNLKEAKALDLRGKELIEDKFIVLPRLWRRQVVEPFSGARYFGEPYKVPESDHFSITKPADRHAIQHRLLLQFVDSFLKDTPSVADLPTLPIHVSKSLISNRLLIAGVESTLSSVETFEIAPRQNAVLFDNATMGFAVRALSLSEEGSRFDGIHVSCLQQLVEAIVLHDIILVPALSESSWLEHLPVDLTACGIHIVRIPPALDSFVRDEAVVWLSEWMNDNAARGLIARLLHIQKNHWERKGLSLERHTADILDIAGIKDSLTAIWEDFVTYSSTHHLSAPGRTYSVDEWGDWLQSVRSHGLSLLHWLVYRPFYYHILAGYIWKVPYCAHPSRGLALAFESFERRTSLAKVALAMVADVQHDFASWVNRQLGQQMFSAEMPPIFRWVLNEAERPEAILGSAVALRSSPDGRAFRIWSGKITSEGADNPNAIHQACIRLAHFAQDVRRRWGVGGAEHDVLHVLRCDASHPAGGRLRISGTQRSERSLLFLRRMSESILSASELSSLYDKHFRDRDFNAERFDEAHAISDVLRVERKKSRRELGRERLREEALRAAAFRPAAKPPEKQRSNAFYLKQRKHQEADGLARILYGWNRCS